MDLDLIGKKPTFRRQRGTNNPSRMLILAILLVFSLFLFRGVVITQEIESPFAPTPIPTRTADSYRYEGETQFVAGNLTKAIEAYRGAVNLEPENTRIMSELARIMVYSSTALTTTAEKRVRLLEALEIMDRAVEVDPDNSTVHAVRSFVLNWLANRDMVGDEYDSYLVQAEQAAVRAIQLDSRNALALAYYAEILLDQFKWQQAEQNIIAALEQDDSLMDVRRINAYILESTGDYNAAIEEYKRASLVNPNLTFLLIRTGVIYRHLAQTSRNEEIRQIQYNEALDLFARAVNINRQLGINDPIPYIAIANTYVQMGEFFIAGRNMRAALGFDPTNPRVYANLGMVYWRSRNYEGAIPAFKCAVYGCDAKESCLVREQCREDTALEDIDPKIEIQGLELDSTTAVYYYVYGSVLAGMHRPGDPNNYCVEAVKVLSEVRARFSDNAEIMHIVRASEEICASYNIRAVP
jgi:tetratricopeptide (TPR) repeat protein